ncbi:MAG: hypothetical protein L0206_25630, partial [Actinobacteria bacterium]|nr:hypothetical protein [Actinomycetota bacterium]
IPYSAPDHRELGSEQPANRLQQAIEDAIDRRAVLAFEEYSARSLCGACAGFAAELDARSMSLLTPMVDGDVRKYDGDEQRTLAAWAARTAYAALAVERKSVGVPKSHRRALREHGEPHANVFVGFGNYRKNHVGVLAGRLFTRLDEQRKGVEAYSVLAVLGHMVVKVFGVHRLPAGVRVKPPEGEMVRAWPPHLEVVDWPPIWSLSEQTLEHAFLHEPFYRPFSYSQVRYLGPNKKAKIKYRRTEGLGPGRG